MPDEPADVEPIDEIPIPVDALLGNRDSTHLGDTVHHLEIAEHRRRVHEGLWAKFGDDLIMDPMKRFAAHEHRINEPEQQVAGGYARRDRGIAKGIEIEVDKQNRITVTGARRQQVGQVAAEIRSLRKPETYKGKGIRYADEEIRRKVGKAGVK